MKIDNYGNRNIADMLVEMESEIETHIEMLDHTRQQIGLLWEECEGLAEHICYLESILDFYEIEYEKLEI